MAKNKETIGWLVKDSGDTDLKYCGKGGGWAEHRYQVGLFMQRNEAARELRWQRDFHPGLVDDLGLVRIVRRKAA